MLKLTVPPIELFDERTYEFTSTKPMTLQLEHSLVSLSKWESKWCKAFLKDKQKTSEELCDYIRCMTITQNVDPMIFTVLPASIIDKVTKYIEEPMTAVKFPKEKNAVTNREVITSEVIYYWMISYGIPFECQKWHLNRLLALINVCGIKSNPPKGKKVSPKDYAARRALNAARCAKYHTTG